MIVKGRRADFILLSSNPLTDINNINDRIGVMIDGKWLTTATLSEMLLKVGLNQDGTQKQ